MRERIKSFLEEVVERATFSSVLYLIVSVVPALLLIAILFAGAILGFFFPDNLLRLSAMVVSLIGMVPAAVLFYNGVNAYFRT